MAILKIARMGHPVLRQPAEPVDDPAMPGIRELVDDMIDTLADAGGVGLAAPQVHVPKRVVILFVPDDRAGEDEDDQPQPLTILINPEIEPLTEDMDVGWEACLSVPGLMGMVPRFKRIRYSWTGLDGEKCERTASGFHARVVQHECDHLDGVLYPTRMTDLSTLGYEEEVNRTLARARRRERAAE